MDGLLCGIEVAKESVQARRREEWRVEKQCTMVVTAVVWSVLCGVLWEVR